MNKKVKTGIVDVGGGLRGIYGAGVFDYCIDNGIAFDCCIGVSAGGANIASFAANQKGRNYRFYHEYAFRKEYMGIGTAIKTGNYINLDYIYADLSNKDGENPLDFNSVRNYDGIINIVATNARTGKPHYFTVNDMQQDNYKVLCASSCVPVINKPVEINGEYYYDGGLSDPIPVRRAFELGCDRVVVVLTRNIDCLKKGKIERYGAKIIKKRFPVLEKTFYESYKKYNDTVALIKQYEKEGKCIVLHPDTSCKVRTFSRDAEKLDRLYRFGYSDAEEIKRKLSDEVLIK